jgi:hypothetical protein
MRVPGFGVGSKRAAFAAIAILVVACGQLLGIEDPDFASFPPSDAATTESSTGDAQTLPEGDAADAGAPCSIVFVAPPPQGSDSNDGCASSAPKATIAAAIERARPLGAASQEIRICFGSYIERGLTLDIPVSVTGGYDCATWNIPDAAAPTDAGDAGPTATTIRNGDYEKSHATLRITSPAVTESVRVSGLTFIGAASGSLGSIAVLVDNGAAPTITSCSILGGATDGRSNGEIAGSIGLYVNGAAPQIVNDAIFGGTGTSDGTVIASVGAAFENGALVDLRDSVVNGGSGQLGIGLSSKRRVTAGVYVSEAAAIEIVGNRIHGGAGYCGADDIVSLCETSGIEISQSKDAPVNVFRNRIHGGELTFGVEGANAALYGIHLHMTEGLSLPTQYVWNNEVNSGGTTSDGTRTSLTGIRVAGGSGVSIVWNTIYVAPRTPDRAIDVVLDANCGPPAAPHPVDFRYNVLVGGNGRNLMLNRGTAGWRTSSFADNVVLTDKEILSDWTVPDAGAGCAAPKTYTTIASAEAALAGQNNLQIACAPDSGLQCPRQLLAIRTGASFNGGANLLIGGNGGWVLRDDASCAVRAVNLDGGVLVGIPDGGDIDVFGNPRTIPYAMGADEHSSAGCP